MARTLLLMLFSLLACALPASASAASLSLSTPSDQTFTGPKLDVSVTASGTADGPGEELIMFGDDSGRPCGSTAADEQAQAWEDSGVNYSVPGGDFAQPEQLEILNPGSPDVWKACAYLYPYGGDQNPGASPAAAAGSGEFKAVNTRAKTGAERATFAFIIPSPRAAKPTITLNPGDQLWLGGSFGYAVNPVACTGPSRDVTWYSEAFKGVATTRSHGEPAVTSKVDHLSGLTLKLKLSGALAPGSYPIGISCADGSQASAKHVLHIVAAKSGHRKKRRH